MRESVRVVILARVRFRVIVKVRVVAGPALVID